jgi:hypothetical protein
MLLKCDKCGWISVKEFDTSEIESHRFDTCFQCGAHMLDETHIAQALILADLEDKGLMLPVGADSDRAMIVVSTDGVKANGNSTEPGNRFRASSREFHSDTTAQS